MKKKFFTHLGHAFDDLNYVQFVMKEIVNGTKIDEIKREFVEENPVGIKTESSRKTYINWIIKGYVKGFKQKELEIFAKVISDERVHPQTKKEIMFWKNCRSDDLVRKITIDFIFEKFYSVKSFKRKELIDFISKRISLRPSTLEKMASGYLSIAGEVGILSPKGNRYSFNFYRPRFEPVMFVLFYLLNSRRTPSQILNSEDFKYLLLNEKRLVFFLKEMNSKNLISFAMSGNVIRIEPKIEFEAIADVLGT